MADECSKQLAAAAQLQASLSASASRINRSILTARWVTFALSVTASLFAAVASQLPQEGGTRIVLAITSAVLLGIVSFVSLRLLGQSRVASWTRLRAASEAVKREGFKCAARCRPYDFETRGPLLAQECENISRDVDDLTGEVEDAAPAGSLPLKELTASEYIESRPHRQAHDYYRARAVRYHTAAVRLRRIEFTLALAATIVTAAIGVAGKSSVFGSSFDFVALTAVLTTIGGAILAHIEASRYDFLVTSYRATARRLESVLANAMPTYGIPSSEWSDFVEQCETILAEEAGTWMAKFSKPSPGGQ